MIHVLYPACEKILKTAMGRLMKCRAYIEKKGKALKGIDVQDVDLQLKSDDFKTMQGKNFLDILEMELLDECLNMV